MSQTAVSRAAIFVLVAAAALGVPGAGDAAQRIPNAAGTRPAAEAAPPVTIPGNQQTADQTREQLYRLFDNYPPAVARVFKLDPSLMSNPAYLAPYPLLGAFLTQHPEVVHNPGYFLDNVDSPNYYYNNDPKRQQRQEMLAVLAGVGVFFAFLVLMGVATWLIRLVVTHRRWNRLSKVQFDTHSKVLDRLTSNEELLAYVQTPAGRRFLESAPIPMEDASRTMGAPFSRILWSIQAGIVLLILGIGLIQVSRQFSDEPGHLFTVGGILTLSLGGGFIVSAIAAYGLSRKLGLLDPPATDHA
jgi:Na+-transporting methylmalonyl-CoA/oxaloacetate decarboxylase gamma subunit